MPVVIGIVALIAIIAIWFIGAYNALVRLKAMLEEAFSGMDVFLKKRYDLIPNLVETVKGYASHEQETLDRVISARNMAVNPNASIDERVQNEQQLTGALNRLLASGMRRFAVNKRFRWDVVWACDVRQGSTMLTGE